MDQPSVHQTTTPAGWFVDPSGTMRWWDGSAWTEHTAPPAPIGSAAGTQVLPTAGQAAGVNVTAIVALVCGLIPLLGILAIVPGIIALKQIKQTGQRGRIPAIIGITFGSLWLLDFVLAAMNAAAKHG